jgi:heptosyltransferase-1
MDRVNILIIKTSALGDIIHCYETVSYLRNKFPEASIDWVVEERCKELVMAHPEIDRTIVFNSSEWKRNPFSSDTKHSLERFIHRLREKTYDVSFDLQGNIKSGLIAAVALAKDKVGFSRSGVAEWPNLIFNKLRFDPPKGKNIREDYLSLAQNYFNDFTTGYSGLVDLINHPEDVYTPTPWSEQEWPMMVCIGSKWVNKRRTTQAVILSLVDYPKAHFYLVSGNDEERREAEIICSAYKGRCTLLPKLTLSQLQHLMKMMKLVYSMDSLPLHLAGSAGVATISFFGPSLAQKYAPIGEQHKVVQGACPYGITFPKRCPRLRSCPTGACMLVNNEIRQEKTKKE